jgi:putative glutamine amidotransferase
MLKHRKPLIGITCGLGVNKYGSDVCTLGQAYTEAIFKAGGIPLIIPIARDQADSPDRTEVLASLDGLLLTGGGDINPDRFDGKPHARVYGVSDARDTLEMALVRAAVSQDLPLLAICRGIQVLNVAFGGTLYTDIQDQHPDALRHAWFPDIPRDYLAHSVRVDRNSLLFSIFQTENVRVNSLHHQGVAQVGRGLTPIAFAPDGIVEALVVQNGDFAVGVQWHPECLPEDRLMQKLFKSFITACSQG